MPISRGGLVLNCFWVVCEEKVDEEREGDCVLLLGEGLFEWGDVRGVLFLGYEISIY